MLWCPLKEGEEQEGGMAGVVPTKFGRWQITHFLC